MRWPGRPPSIAARLALAAMGLTALALALAWVAVSALLADFVDRRLSAELEAALRGVMAATTWTEDGELLVVPPPPDPRYEQPGSGWGWTVGSDRGILAAAPALLGAGIDPSKTITRARVFTAPGDAQVLTVTAALPMDERDAALDAIRWPLLVSLAVVGLALAGAQLLAIRLGLRALRRFAADLDRLRLGALDRLPDPKMRELIPLAQALNALLSANADTIARARTHVGNLAHALKGPLATLMLRAKGPEAGLLAQMDRMIRWHLRRAALAGPGAALARATPVGPVLEDLALVFAPQAARRGIILSLDPGPVPAFAGEAQDLAEMLGNLVENALAHARSTVRLNAPAAPPGRLVLTVEDDGPGIPAEERDRLMARGARLDEATTAGSGLGLAILADLVALYEGRLTLAEAPHGGLCARLELPAVR
ncbi:MAG: sensor histidine kinase [Gemmobacter sp.]